MGDLSDLARAERLITASIFGPLSVKSAGRKLGPSSFGGVKPKALFEILLLARGRLVSKDALAEALWPGALPKNVTGTLETYACVLRRQLSEDRAHARRVMVTASGAYRIDLDEITLDVDRFDDLLRRADGAGHQARRALRIEAVALATGDLLEDEPYADWAQMERELYRERVARTHLLIAEDALADGDVGVALRHGEAALTVKPFSEKAVRSVMLAHHALGHGETAQEVFARCRRVLDRELGVDPSAETAALATAIGTGIPAHALVVPARRPSTTPEKIRPWDRRDPSRRMPFIGRVAELANLRARVEACRQGRFEFVVVEGRPGIGRTTLLDQLHGSLPGAVGLVAYSPRELDRPALPFSGALIDALRLSPGVTDAERYSGAPWLSGIGDSVESVCDLARRHGPIVLLLDDLHWADAGTIEALEYLWRRAPAVPLAIIVTVRVPASDGDSVLLRLGAVERVALTALAPSDALATQDVGPELVRTTGGNPRAMADIWRWEHSGGAGLSPSLEDAVKRRVRGLGAGLPAILQAASALPETFGPGELVGVTGAPERALEADLDRLVALAYLENTVDGLRFAEPVMRDVLATTVAQGRRAGADGPELDDPTKFVAA